MPYYQGDYNRGGFNRRDPGRGGFGGTAIATGIQLLLGGIPQTLPEAIDFILGFVPGISAVQLLATLAAFGWPESEVLQFFSAPAEFLTREETPGGAVQEEPVGAAENGE